MSRTSRTRALAAVAIAGLAGGSLTLLAPPASAAPIGAVDSASASPTVYAGIPSQAAGDWTLAALPAVSLGDTVTIEVDDVDAAANCAATGDSIGFASAPVVANTTEDNMAAFSVAMSPSAGACTVAGVDSVLTLTATATGDAGAILELTAVAYDVGSAAAVGAVRHQVNGGGFGVVDSNATVSAVRVASTDPANLVPLNTQDTPIGDIVLAEQRAGAIPTTGAFVKIQSPAGVTFQATPLPTVTAAGGNGVPGVVTVSGAEVSFLTTASTGTAGTTYTVHGLQLDTTGSSGPVVATVGTTSGGTELHTGDRLAFVGETDRISGSDRYATAARIAFDEFGCLAGDKVVVARGDAFPDALAASYLAGQHGVPILLTEPTSVPSATIQALEHHGVTDVVLIGGTSAISEQVEDYLDALPTQQGEDCEGNDDDETITVDRVAGADRYATAKAVAEKFGLDEAGTMGSGPTGDDCDDAKTAIVASGENFPDALAAGGLAYGGVWGCGGGALPMLLTPKSSLSPDASGAIDDLDIEHVILVGGTAAVDAAVETALEALPGVSVVRIAGADRQATAVALAERILGPENFGDWDSQGFLVARPDSFPDALAASSLSGNHGWPMFLAGSTSSLGATTASGIAGWSNGFDLGTVVGGTTALADTVLAQMATAIASQAFDI